MSRQFRLQPRSPFLRCLLAVSRHRFGTQQPSHARNLLQKELYHLVSFPYEMLQRIVILGPCENAIALSRVWRKFHQVCRDPPTYTGIVQSGNRISHDVLPKSWTDHDLQPFLESLTDWWTEAGLHHEKDATIVAQWASQIPKRRTTTAIQAPKTLIIVSGSPNHADIEIFARKPRILPFSEHTLLDSRVAITGHPGMACLNYLLDDAAHSVSADSLHRAATVCACASLTCTGMTSSVLLHSCCPMLT
ncbi:uncharacterized protein BCR38DRAFT_410230 [Pseudomassariella vexata]|uniref:F-box domain-containing protein n=1 Tax=Pseudomassariella vexata TaxID=1141098 RepID=A0A1Y2DVH1_9PEZI|nr:uncharacterized protein BCR38DRAFT_410230 [Pseudomassariella vexata]ORY63290.1 hypothetical protein BCR38DRAFT_410230 [Pseudomassariella vexata]